jgi:4,5-dihydroxyphthalate decarboxylase
MSRLRLSLACGPYDLLTPLIDGVVTAAGVDLTMLTMASPERHGRMLRHEEFDVCELSLVGYLAARDQGRAFTAIPVFPHRRFRHSYAVKRMHCGIDAPADLNGKRVGLDTLQNSAGLWMRGILQDHYGVDLRSIEWWCQEAEDVPFTPPPWMRVHRVSSGRNIDRMLVDGDLEGAVYPETLPSVRSGSPHVGLLFPNPREAEIDYYRKTGIFPIMHVMGIKQEIVERHPWVPINMFQAFQKAKTIGMRRMNNPRAMPLAWYREAWEEQEKILGPDPWEYGLTDKNRHALTTVAGYSHEQGLTQRK